MNKATKPVLLVAVAVAVMGLLSYQLAGSKEQGTEGQSLAELSRRIDALERRQQLQLAALQDSMNMVLSASGMTAPTSTTAVASTAAKAPPQLGLTAQNNDPAREARERDALIRAMESQHARDKVDAAWAGPAESRLLSNVQNPTILSAGLRPKSIDTDCRSRSCRIEASFASSGDAEDWMTFYLTGVGNTLSQARPILLPQPDGSTIVRIYGTRK